jgi:hypothetical protein
MPHDIGTYLYFDTLYLMELKSSFLVSKLFTIDIDRLALLIHK